MTAKLCSLMCMLKCIRVLFFLYNLDQGGTDHLSQFLQETNTKNKEWGCVFTPDGYIFPYCSALWKDILPGHREYKDVKKLFFITVSYCKLRQEF